mmetsp:Transcript_4092/g.5948  ORF Transcript_4092/g.5948 Transcript_4092/m.5948 type:complete len:129 (+) Transcript_4092:2-388(+)
MSIVEDCDQLTTVQNLIGTGTQNGESSESNDTNDDNSVRMTRPLMADKKSFEITSRDRLYRRLSKLPKLFHLEVNECFKGSSTLFDHTAAELAKRLIRDEVPIEELKKAGYHDDIVTVVQEKMRTFGV